MYILGQKSGLGRIGLRTYGALYISTTSGNGINFSGYNNATTTSPGTSDGVTQFQILPTASAVNYLSVTGAAAGGAPTSGTQVASNSSAVAAEQRQQQKPTTPVVVNAPTTTNNTTVTNKVASNSPKGDTGAAVSARAA